MDKHGTFLGPVVSYSPLAPMSITREHLDALYGECDLVLIVPTAGTGIVGGGTNFNPYMVSAGGDIDLQISSYDTKISKTSDWRLPTATLRRVNFDGTSIETYVTGHTLAPRVARGYRIFYVDVVPTPAVAHSWSIDPENEWIVGAQVWCANPLTDQIRFEFYDGLSSGPLLHTEILSAGASAYVDVSSFVHPSYVTVLGYYWHTPSSSWRFEGSLRIFRTNFDDYGVAPATLLVNHPDSGPGYDFRAGGALPFPHIT